jgi:hypothetical protein
MKYSEQAPMSIGWYINEIKRLEAEREDDVDEIKFLRELLQNLFGDKWETLTIYEARNHKAAVDRLTMLVQEHQAYQSRQGDKT